MQIHIINSESLSIGNASACHFQSVVCLYLHWEGRVMDVVVARSDSLEELVVEMNHTCTAGEL